MIDLRPTAEISTAWAKEHEMELPDLYAICRVEVIESEESFCSIKGHEYKLEAPGPGFGLVPLYRPETMKMLADGMDTLMDDLGVPKKP